MFKNFVRKIAHLMVYGHKASSKLYIEHLRRGGAEIGPGATFFDSTTIKVDEGDLWMLTIGKNFQCTGGVNILTHDYGWSVTKAVYGDVLGSVRPITIGDNVYVGRNAMILAGAKIGNNVIIGANSVVTGNIPDNCVAVGSPCKPLYSLEEYHRKRCAVQEKEAIEIARCYYKRFHKKPPIDIFSEHFWVFANDNSSLPEHFNKQNKLMPGSEEKTIENFEKHIPAFKDYEEFLGKALSGLE